MVKYCPECNIEVGDTDKVCGTCGYDLEIKTVSGESVDDVSFAKEMVSDEIIADDIVAADVGFTKATTEIPPVYTKAPVALEETAKVMTLGDWMITLLLLFIPIVNIVMLIVWCADAGTNKNKKHFAQAYLIYMAITFVISIIFSGILISIMLATIGSMAY
ncbi:MAG: zinc ribbon domain-containing protein [Acetobacterium sp.]